MYPPEFRPSQDRPEVAFLAPRLTPPQLQADSPEYFSPGNNNLNLFL